MIIPNTGIMIAILNKLGLELTIVKKCEEKVQKGRKDEDG